MKRLIIFIFALFAGFTAHATEYTVLCPDGYYVVDEHCEPIPKNTDTDENGCTAGQYYAQNETQWWMPPECQPCPDEYPNSDPNTTSINQCYSNTKTRENDGTVACRTIPDGCTYAKCTVCESEPAPCEYVEYYDGTVKSGCSVACVSDIIDTAYNITNDIINKIYNPESGVCESCGMGTYLKTIFDLVTFEYIFECIKCDAGTYNPTSDATDKNACIACPAGTYSNAGAAACEPCPAGTYSNTTGAAQCTQCPYDKTSPIGATSASQCVTKMCDAGYYGDGETCDKCPDNYPNSDAGATQISDCYSDTKLREWTGEQTTPDTLPAGCTDATYGECKIDACEYVAYGGFPFWATEGYDYKIKSGCETNDANCTKPILSVTANPGYITNGNACEKCPAGTYSPGGDATECVQCPKNTYSAAGAVECTPCPDEYPNANAGAIGHEECYSNIKERPWTGYQVCTASAGCITALCAPCEIKPCKYVAYATVDMWWEPAPTDGEIKSGCPSNNANCSTPVQSLVAAPGYRTVGTQRCEICPAGTYGVGGANAQCEKCPNGATSFAGAAARDECMRKLNYLRPGDTDPTKILLSLKKPKLPALAVQIGDDVFYGKMTPVDTTDKSGLYVEYNGQPYHVQDNTNHPSSFYIHIITEPNTSADGNLTWFRFYISAAGEFTVDWGDGTVEDFIYETVADEYNPYRIEHDYGTAGDYTVRISGRATAYSKTNTVIQFSISPLWWIPPTDTESRIYGITGSLGGIFPTLDDGTNPSFQYMFYGASNLSGEIPVGLFGNLNNTKPDDNMFVGAFSGCTRLTGPTAHNPDGTRLYDTIYNGQKWIDAYPNAFTDMYLNSGISD